MKDRYFYNLAGDSLSDLVDGYCFGHPGDETLRQIESDMDRKPKDGSMGHHHNFDECEAEATTAMKEADAPFAIIYKGSKIYGVITKDKTITHEVV